MKHNWLRVLGWAAVLLSLAIVGSILWRSAGQLRDLEWRQFLWSGLVGLGLYGISLALQAFVWTGLVSKLSLSSWGWRDVQVYFATHLTKRLPGLPWYMAGRAIIYKKQGRSGEAALVASLLEWGGMFIAASLWAVLGHFGGAWVVLALLGMGALLVVAYRAPSGVPRVGKWELLTRLPVHWLLLAGGGYGFAWFLGGLIMYSLVPSSPRSSMSLIDITSLWTLSGGASMLMAFVPAGLGVREITLSLLLRPHIGDAVALVVALLMRVLFTLGDLVWGGIFWLLARYLGSHSP